MPWGDWQFWLVSVAAGWGVWAVVRQLLPRRGAGEPACANCEVGVAARKALDEARPPGSERDQAAS